MLYNTLVLSGGSICTLNTLGSIQYYADNHLLKEISTYAGTSAGAIIVYLLAIGYTPTEIIAYLCANDIFEHLQSIDIVSMAHGKGAISFSGFQEHLERMTIDKIGRFVTFKDVYEKMGKKLVMTTYNYTEKQLEILSPETTPDLPCLIGIRMSCCLPLVFHMYKYNGCFYLDGGVYNDFPVQILETKESKILGIYISIFHDHDKELPTNLLEYLYKLLLIPRETNIHKIHEKENIEIVSIESSLETFFNFSLTHKQKLDMFSNGYQIAKSHHTN